MNHRSSAVSSAGPHRRCPGALARALAGLLFASIPLHRALAQTPEPAAEQAPEAQEEGAPDIVAARKAFSDAVTRFQAGDLAGALERFEESDQLHHAPEITYNIGRVHEGLGHAQAAVDAYEAYLAEAGASAQYSSAATLALAEIRGRAARLRIETRPEGAVVTVDGVQARDKTPVTLLVFHGRHQVSIELGTWREAKPYDAAKGAEDTLVFDRPEPKRERAAPRQPPPPSVITSQAPELSGFLAGVSLSVSGFWFVGSAAREQSGAEVTTADTRASGLVYGLSLELGYALRDDVAVVARGFGSLGSAEGELAALGTAGLTASWRAGRRWWLGAGGVVGVNRANSDATTRSSLVDAHSTTITYRTDFAVGPMLELSYALGQNEDGQWLVGVMPGLLLTTNSEHSSLFVPLMVGHRWL